MSGGFGFKGIGVGTPGPAGPAGPAGATGGSGPGLHSNINPYFGCFQQGGAGGTMPLVNGGTAADGWIQQSETPAADLVERRNGSAAGSSSRTQFKISKGGSSGKLFVANFFNLDNSKSWEGTTMVFAVDIQQPDGIGGAVDARLGILSAASGIDTIPRPMVTAWNGPSVDPTLDPGLSILGAITVTPGVFAYGTFAVAAAVPFGTPPYNFGVAVWSDDDVPVGGSLSLARGFPLPSGSALVYPQLAQTGMEMAACQQYIEKSYDPDVTPGTVTDVGALAAVGGELKEVRYRSSKNFDPAGGPGANPQNGITLYSPVTGATGMWRDVTAGADVAAAVVDSGKNGFVASNAAPAGNTVRGHWVANAAL